jgi:hypothetical protein
VIFAVLILAAVALLYLGEWPSSDPEVVQQLADPACKMWVNLPPGYTPDDVVGESVPCRALYDFLRQRDLSVRTVTDYSRYLRHRRMVLVATGLGLWAVIAGGAYLAGWSVAWVRRGFGPTSGPAPPR